MSSDPNPPQKHTDRYRRSVPLLLAALLGLCVWVAAAVVSWSPDAVHQHVSETWDVIVVGSEPEAIAAAVAAAESGASTLLVTSQPRLGGLFVMGEMNVLDLRTTPFNYHQGLFQRWWDGVGRGHSFDVERAEARFTQLLEEAGVTAIVGAATPAPVMDGGKVTGVRVADHTFHALQVIDGTADMDFAAAAGAAHTIGWESLGVNERMVDTLVFRIEGVNWQTLRQTVRARGNAYAWADEWVAWGHFGGYPAAYQAEEEGIRLRGLNLGRQEDGTILVNALLIYGVDLFDPESIRAGYERAAREAPRVVEYLSHEIPGFQNARLAGVASELYVRESRHLVAECTLTADHVMDNRVGPLDIAAGGYPLDVQTLTPTDNGFVFGVPEMFGVPLCVTVPEGLSNLWVAGKAAGYDPIAASSARVVPLGMTVGEAVGVGAALAARLNTTAAAVATHEGALKVVRESLARRGAYLPEVADRSPVGPHRHPHYPDYRLMLSRGMALGGYGNDPQLDQHVPARSFVYLMCNVASRFYFNDSLCAALKDEFEDTEGALTTDIAWEVTEVTVCALLGRPAGTLFAEQAGPTLVSSTASKLTRGQMYSLAATVASHSEPSVQTEPGPGC